MPTGIQQQRFVEHSYAEQEDKNTLHLNHELTMVLIVVNYEDISGTISIKSIHIGKWELLVITCREPSRGSQQLAAGGSPIKSYGRLTASAANHGCLHVIAQAVTVND